MGFTQIFVNTSPGPVTGPRHWKIKLSDDQVEQIRVLREDHRWSYGRLAKHFNTPRTTIQYICLYKRR